MHPAPHFHTGLVWFRRDLRADDHTALSLALRHCKQVHAVFVFDSDILAPLPRADRRVEFIRESVVALDSELRLLAHKPEAGLIVLHGQPAHEIPRLAKALGAQAVFAHHDDEPAALARDTAVRGALAGLGVAFHTRKDHVVFERNEVLSASGKPYAVFTPYKNAWLARLQSADIAAHPVAAHAHALAARPAAWQRHCPELADLGFERTNLLALKIPTGSSGARQLLADFETRIDRYAELRNFPAVKGPSYLSTHLRFGTISIRQLVRMAWARAGGAGTAEVMGDFRGGASSGIEGSSGACASSGVDGAAQGQAGPGPLNDLASGTPAPSSGPPSTRPPAPDSRAQGAASDGAATWLNELIWREFYFQVLYHHPHVVSRSFKPAYDAIKWERGNHAQLLFKAWCDGQTGYPLVDAAMLQLNQTGYMHNRLRMVAGSFLVKDLGIDWRWGERYFADKLNDYDLAANNGGWQWVASSGCDAQPWFRIFNPVTQSERYDPQGKFIRRYLPQLAALQGKALHAPWQALPAERAAANVVLGIHYPAPIVIHEEARAKTLARYAVVKEREP